MNERGYYPFEKLKNMKITKKRCKHKWIKKDGKITCEVCQATGFYSKEKNTIFMKKNATNNALSLIDIELYSKYFK